MRASEPAGEIPSERSEPSTSADCQRFVMVRPVDQEQSAPTQINVVLNWTEELKRVVPPGK